MLHTKTPFQKQNKNERFYFLFIVPADGQLLWSEVLCIFVFSVCVLELWGPLGCLPQFNAIVVQVWATYGAGFFGFLEENVPFSSKASLATRSSVLLSTHDVIAIALIFRPTTLQEKGRQCAWHLVCLLSYLESSSFLWCLQDALFLVLPSLTVRLLFALLLLIFLCLCVEAWTQGLVRVGQSLYWNATPPVCFHSLGPSIARQTWDVYFLLWAFFFISAILKFFL